MPGGPGQLIPHSAMRFLTRLSLYCQVFETLDISRAIVGSVLPVKAIYSEQLALSTVGWLGRLILEATIASTFRGLSQ